MVNYLSEKVSLRMPADYLYKVGLNVGFLVVELFSCVVERKRAGLIEIKLLRSVITMTAAKLAS